MQSAERVVKVGGDEVFFSGASLDATLAKIRPQEEEEGTREMRMSNKIIFSPVICNLNLAPKRAYLFAMVHTTYVSLSVKSRPNCGQNNSNVFPPPPFLSRPLLGYF